MIQYLYNNRGKINRAKKQKNLGRMKEPYNVTDPTALFFTRIEEFVDYTDAAHSPISNQ